MKKYEERTQKSCFSQLRRKGFLPLTSLNEHMKIYKKLESKEFICKNDTLIKDFILFNSKYVSSYIPLCCDHYVLVLNLSGNWVSYINQYKYEIEETSLHLIPAGLIHSFKSNTKPKELFVLFFEYEFLANTNFELLEFFQNDFSANKLNSERFSEAKYIFDKLYFEYNNKKIDYKEYCKTLILQLLYILKREKSYPSVKITLNKSQQIAEKFLDLIEENFQRKKSVKEYAFMLDITPKHLSETIKDSLNQSALFLIHKRIIKEIQYQLCYTVLSIKEISSSLYFNNSSDFGRFFKRYEKLTPNVYRLKYKQ